MQALHAKMPKLVSAAALISVVVEAACEPRPQGGRRKEIR
jgi:hypothetical protein